MDQFNEKLYNEARLVAMQAHGNQVYDGIFPYVKHLDDVVAVLKRYGFGGGFIIAGFLHDTLEDSSISYNKIKNHFGEEVAEIVYCVTDELGRNRKEKKEKTLPKTAGNNDAIIVKLADRIANIEMGGKIDMYVKEYDEFCKHLRGKTTDTQVLEMWKHLDKLLGVVYATVS